METFTSPLERKSHWKGRGAGHFCESSRTTAMNHRTRSRVKSLELAGNEKSRLDEVAILFPHPRFGPPPISALCTRPLPPAPRKFVWKVWSAKWCFVVAWKEDISYRNWFGSVFHPTLFDFPAPNPSFPQPFDDGLRKASPIPRNYEPKGRRERRDDQLEKLNYFVK